MKDVYINNITAFLPNDPVSNDEMEQVLGLINDQESISRRLVLRNNGINQRYYVIDKNSGVARYTNAELTAESIKKLNDKDFNLNEIDLLACGTSSPDLLFPSHGLMVHGELNIPACEVVTNAGVCTSAVTAMNYAYMAVKCSLRSNAVVCGSEVASTALQANKFTGEIGSKQKILENKPIVAFEKEFLRWMLSDGAGSVLIQDRKNEIGISLRIDWIEQKSYANMSDVCMYLGGEKNESGEIIGWQEFDSPQAMADDSIFTIKQDVKLLGENIGVITEKSLSYVLDKYDLNVDNIDYFLPHISSMYFTKERRVIQKLGCEKLEDKWFTNLDTKGNIGAASIFIMLEELYNSGKLKVGERILCYVPESSRFNTAWFHLTVV